MGSLRESSGAACEEVDKGEENADEEGSSESGALRGEHWPFGGGEGAWQTTAKTVKDRMRYLRNNRDMSDLLLLACDENWWFGETVKDYTAHKFVLGAASPVLHKILYELDETENPDRRLILDPRLEVTLTLTPCYDYVRLEVDGVPPIAAEALLDYIYNDSFNESDFENGYSRNLLWRLWHASKALEMDHLCQMCSRTLFNTMGEETVFWDLNYAMHYKQLGTGEIMTKVLKLVDEYNEKVYENPNFVWLEHDAVREVLKRRKQGSCDPMIVYNNLLRWTLYQIDRSACCEVDEQTGADIDVTHRLQWLEDARAGKFDHVARSDVDKYTRRGMEMMPWTELSQKDFLEHVVPRGMLGEEELLQKSVELMDIVVKNPGRLLNSSFHLALTTVVEANSVSSRAASRTSSSSNLAVVAMPAAPAPVQPQVQQLQIQPPTTPTLNRRGTVSSQQVLSRTNNLRRSLNEVRLRMAKQQQGKSGGSGSKSGSRPVSSGGADFEREAEAAIDTPLLVIE